MTNRTHAVLVSLALAVPSLGLADDCGPPIDLYAGPTTLALPGGGSAYMWGYGTSEGAITAPGPVLRIPAGCDSQEIRLHNGLRVPTSVILPGQPSPTDSFGNLLAPARTDLGPKHYPDYSPLNNTGEALVHTQRATALTAETAPGAVRSYFFRGLRAGTYLYQSGSDLAVQVQMGLAGAAVIDYGLGQAYPGVAYTRDLVLVLSEVDPAVHAVVAAGDASGGTPVYGLPGVVNYRPRYFLVNGKAWPAPALQNVPAGAAGDLLLVRLLNAGLQSRAPEIAPVVTPGDAAAPGGAFSFVAEDGHPYPRPRGATAGYMPAGKTRDALVRLVGDRYAIYDRANGLGNGAGASGGQLLTLGLGNATRAVAPDRAYVDDPSVPSLSVSAAAGLLSGVLPPPGQSLSAVLVSPASHGTVAVTPGTGAFTYTPTGAPFVGWDTFTYKLTTSPGAADSNVATVSIHVPAGVQAPTANADAYSGFLGMLTAVPADGVLHNDVDNSGVGMKAQLATGSSCPGDQVSLNQDGSFSYFPSVANGLARTCTFTYRAIRAALPATYSTATVTFTLAQAGPAAPVAIDDFGSTTLNVLVNVAVKGNDYSPTGATPLGALEVVTPPWGKGSFAPSGTPNNGDASAVVQGNVIRFTPAFNFRGTDSFTYRVRDGLGRWSNVATVRVDVK